MATNKKMIIPLGSLINSEGNMYELTNASIHRASQISAAGCDDLDKNKGKVVSTALEQIISEKVKYQYE